MSEQLPKITTPGIRPGSIFFYLGNNGKWIMRVSGNLYEVVNHVIDVDVIDQMIPQLQQIKDQIMDVE